MTRDANLSNLFLKLDIRLRVKSECSTRQLNGIIEQSQQGIQYKPLNKTNDLDNI